jgi:hypothetical protein
VDPDSLNPNPIRIQSFDDQQLKKINTADIFLLSFLDQKLQFTYVQATGEDVNPQKRTSSTSKNEIYIKKHPPLQKVKFNFFLCLRVIFALLDPDPGTLMNPDPDPQY